MDHYEFRVEPAAAWILGKQVAGLMDETLREVIMETIRPESKIRMINHSLKERSFLGSHEREAETALMLEAFEQGLLA
jgi:hypothetical protein